MRTAQQIKTFAEKHSVNLNTTKLIDSLNRGLSNLYLNEEVVDVFCDDSYRKNNHSTYLLTDKNRLICCYENETTLFEDIFDLNNLNPNTISAKSIDEGGFFGKRFAETIIYSTTLNANGYPLATSIYSSENAATTISKKILNHQKKYSVGKQINTQNQSQPTEISEIRKLYEDGIISKSEMLELIKESVKK